MMLDLRRFRSALGALCLLASGTAPGGAGDAPLAPAVPDELETEEAREPREKRVDLRLSLRTELDDNVLHLRDDAIEDFESGDFPADRFLIRSVDDLIFVPSLDFVFSLTPETRKRSRLRLTANVYQYSDNPIKDYEQVRLTFEQDFSDSRADLRALELLREDLTATRFRTRRSFRLANRSRLQLRYFYDPERYQGQLTDDDGGGRKSALYTRRGWSARYYQRLNRGEANRLRLMLRIARDEVDYNVDFDERDSDRDRVALGLDLFTLRPESFWQWGLAWEVAERKSNTALIGRPGPAGTIEDDLSYDAGVVTLSVRRFWYRERGLSALYKADNFQLSARFGAKDYITANLNDRTHFGRDDDYLALTAAYHRALSNDVTVGLKVEYSEQQTNLDPVEGFDRLEPSDFDNLVVGAQLSYYTGWKSKTRRPARERRPLPMPVPEPAPPAAAEDDPPKEPEVALPPPEAELAPITAPPVEESKIDEREDAVPGAASDVVSEVDSTGETDMSLELPAGGRIYELQLALFHRQENAAAMVEDFTERGYRPYVVEVESSKGETRYTVRIGPYRSMEEAAGMATTMRRDLGLATVIRFRSPTP